MIKIASANFFVGNTQVKKDAEFLRDLGVEVAGIQEGHSGNAQGIRNALYKTHITWWGRANTIAEQDVPVVISRKLNVQKVWTRRISKRSQKENIGMPRNATAIRFRKEKEVYTFINVHTNAAVQNRKTGQPLSTRIRRVAEFVAGMIILEAMIRNAKRKGHVIVVGDLNYRTVKSGVWKFSPQAVFKRTKMEFKAHGIDYIAWTRGLNMRNFEVIGTNKTGSDHPWLTADILPKKK